MDPRIHYANTTLIGNWYEDRLDDSKVGKDPRTLRQGKNGETPIKMKRPVPDFYVTQNTISFQRPARSRPNTTVNMVSMNTVRNTLLTDRSVPPRVYNAPLPRHGPDRDFKEFFTTTHSQFGGKYAADPVRRREVNSAPAQIAGISSECLQSMVGRRGRKGAGATGEKLKVGNIYDPKDNTFVQRSWNYNRDGSRYFVDKFERPPEIPGVHLKGLGNSEVYSPNKNFKLCNDTIKHSTGIWADMK